MPKLGGKKFDLAPDGQYVVEIVEINDPEDGEYMGDPTCQLPVTLKIVESLTNGNNTLSDDSTPVVGYKWDEWWSLDAATGAVTKNSKIAQIYEATTGMVFDPEDGIDTDEMIGKQMQCKVVVNDPGTRNRTVYSSYGKVRRGKKGKVENAGQTTEESKAEEATEEDFEEIPF